MEKIRHPSPLFAHSQEDLTSTSDAVPGPIPAASGIEDLTRAQVTLESTQSELLVGFDTAAGANLRSALFAPPFKTIDSPQREWARNLPSLSPPAYESLPDVQAFYQDLEKQALFDDKKRHVSSSAR